MTARILLAEDNDSLSRVLSKFLTAQGHSVRRVAAGDEALAYLARETVDLLVLDLRLPVVSGIEVLQRLRQQQPRRSPPTIIISGIYKGERNVSEARRLGVTHYLEKPFTPQAFQQAINGALAASLPSPPPTLRDLVIDIYDRQKSGVLTIGSGSPIIFVQGEPLSFIAKGNNDFPQFLLGHGKLDRRDLTVYLNNGGERLFLVQAGMLAYEELLEESRLFLTSVLSRALPLSTGYRFTEGSADVETPCVPVTVPRLLYEAARAGMAGFSPELFRARHKAHYPARTTRFFRRINLLALRDDEIQLLARLDGNTQLAGLLSPPVPPEAALFLNVLHALGMIDFHPTPTREELPDFPLKYLFNAPLAEAPEPAPDTRSDFADLFSELSQSPISTAPNEGSSLPPLLSPEEEHQLAEEWSSLQGRTYYELFALTPDGFSLSALKNAYFAKSRQFAPERYFHCPGTIQNMATRILATYAEAYTTLANVVTKERYDELLQAGIVGLDGKQDEQLQAEIHYQAGKVFLGRKDHINAEKALHDAVSLAPNNPSYCAFLAWAIYRNPDNRHSAAARERARRLLGTSLQLGKTAAAHSFRGWMLLDEGRDGLAEGEFRKALRLDAREMHARRGLRTITERQEAEKKGILKRLFG